MKKAILINDTSQECHLGCVQVINNIEKLCEANLINIFARYTRHHIADNVRRDLKENIKKADIIIINGEGSLHHHPRRNTRWFPIFLKMIPDKKKTVLINTLWQDMGKLGEDIKYLDKLNLISVRESLSYKNLLSIYPYPDKVLLIPDLIFATEIEEMKIGYGDSVHHKIKDILKKKKNFLPLSYIDRGHYNEIRKVALPSLQAYINWLKSLDLYVTGRFHGVCISALAGIPFLALTSNSHKIEGILKDMNCQELLIKSLKEVEKKKVKAQWIIINAKTYAVEAKVKIEKLFKKIGQL